MTLPVKDGNGAVAYIASILNAASEHQTTQIVKTVPEAIFQGEIPGTGTIKFGRIPNIALTSSITQVDPTTWKDIWPYAETQAQIAEKTTGATVDVVSSDANDTSAGTGVRTLFIEGIDENWDFQTEIITMNGTTPVTTTKQWIAVNRSYVLTCGTFGTNAGGITFTHTASVISYIEANYGQTAQSAMTTPRNTITSCAGPYLFIIKSASANTVSAVFRTKEFGEGYRVRNYGEAISTGTSYVQAPVGVIANFNALGKARIKAQVINISANNTGCQAGWGFIQVPLPQGQ